MAKQPRVTPREFVPLDSRFIFDEKLAQVGPQAELLFLRSLALAKIVDMDGIIPSESLSMITRGMRSVNKQVALLLQFGLWTVGTNSVSQHSDNTKPQYLIASWRKWNLTEAQRQHIADTKSRAGREGNHKRYHTSQGVFEPDCEFCEQG